MSVAWVRLRRFLKHLEKKREVLRISRPVDVAYEAGAIADLLVKNDGPAVVFEQGEIEEAEAVYRADIELWKDNVGPTRSETLS